MINNWRGALNKKKKRRARHKQKERQKKIWKKGGKGEGEKKCTSRPSKRAPQGGNPKECTGKMNEQNRLKGRQQNRPGELKQPKGNSVCRLRLEAEQDNSCTAGMSEKKKFV